MNDSLNEPALFLEKVWFATRLYISQTGYEEVPTYTKTRYSPRVSDGYRKAYLGHDGTSSHTKNLGFFETPVPRPILVP